MLRKLSSFFAPIVLKTSLLRLILAIPLEIGPDFAPIPVACSPFLEIRPFWALIKRIGPFPNYHSGCYIDGLATPSTSVRWLHCAPNTFSFIRRYLRSLQRKNANMPLTYSSVIMQA